MEPIKHTAKLWERKHEGDSYWLFWCPACKSGHTFKTPRWGFDGKIGSPTFTPSLRLYIPEEGPHPAIIVCHLNVTNGQIIFHGDCPHEMKGMTIPMQDLPRDYGF